MPPLSFPNNQSWSKTWPFCELVLEQSYVLDNVEAQNQIQKPP